MIKALAFDPGITTGYAIGVFNELDNTDPITVVTGQHEWNHFALWTFLNSHLPKFIVYERFDARHSRYRQGVELYSRELIGVIQLYQQMYRNAEIITQGAMKGGESKTLGTHTTYFNDQRLKECGIYKTSRDHANDAARHLLTWWYNGSGGRFESRKRGYKSGVFA